MANELRRHCEQRLKSLRDARQSFDSHWRELANFILPRRYQWLHTTGNASRGSPINSQILDSTGTMSARNLAAGMMGGLTPPTRPWFKLRIPGEDTESSNPASIWLSICERRMMQVMAESNFYNALGIMYFDLVVFGTAPFIIYEDFEDVIRCYNPSAGEYYLANSNRMSVDTIYREYAYTIPQMVKEFGEENLSPTVKSLLEGPSNSANMAKEFLIGHAIEPNDKKFSQVAAKFPYREVYWELGRGEEGPALRVQGYNEFPCVAPRWDLGGNDAYGRSPGMDALPDIKQLQHETKRKAQSIDKLVNPPLVGDIQLANNPSSLLPGGITYVSGLSNTQPGLRPVYQVAPPIAELLQDIQEVKKRIGETFFNDLLLTITNLQTVRTATEIDARREEKLLMVGPVIQRIEGEALTPAVNRVYSIMSRRGLFPDPPPELQKREINIEFVSMFAQAQRASASAGIERLMAFTGNLAAGQIAAGMPGEAFDKIDTDALIDEYSAQMNVPPKLVRDSRSVGKIREARMAQAQKQEAMADAGAAVQGAQVLSQTDVGGGQNALQQILGG